jgi:hypothetical protein
MMQATQMKMVKMGIPVEPFLPSGMRRNMPVSELELWPVAFPVLSGVGRGTPAARGTDHGKQGAGALRSPLLRCA